MATLKGALAAIALWLAAPAAAGPVDRWAATITEASVRFGVPEEWIRRVMTVESGGRASLNGRPIVSRAGAMGLMQVMPSTWREMRALHGLGTDPHDPRDNILAGAAYLRAMYDRFGYPGLFAAYNAGPARYADHLATGRRLPAETVGYMAAVARVRGRGSAAPLAAVDRPRPPAESVFALLPAVERATAASAADGSPAAPRANPLFVSLGASALSPR